MPLNPHIICMDILFVLLFIGAVTLFGPSGGGGRSDYFSGTKGQVAPVPLDRTRLRKRRRQRRKWAAMDKVEETQGS